MLCHVVAGEGGGMADDSCGVMLCHVVAGEGVGMVMTHVVSRIQ